MAATDVLILAQDVALNPDNVDLGKQFFSMQIPESWNKVSRVISVIAMLIWVVYAVFQYFSTKNQGRGIQKIGGVWPLVFASLAAGVFWDLNNVVKLANFMIALGSTGVSALTGLF